MQINPYLSFKGDCEAAFTFYERCLGGQRGTIFRYAGSPMADQVPADWQDKVMHGSLTVGDLVLMGGDVAPDRYEEPKGFSLSIQIKSTADAERIFHDLASGRPRRHAARENILGRPVRHGRRSIRHTVADQLRGSRAAFGSVIARDLIPIGGFGIVAIVTWILWAVRLKKS